MRGPRYSAATTKVMLSAMSTLLSGSAQKENPTISRKMVTGSASRRTIPVGPAQHNTTHIRSLSGRGRRRRTG